MRIRGWIGYTLYGIAITVFFLFFLFPSGLFKSYLESAAMKYINAGVTIDSSSLIFPSTVSLKNCKIHFNGRTHAPVIIDAMKVVPSIKNLLKGKAAVRIEGSAYGGSIKARMIMRNRFSLSGPVTFTGDFQNIDIGKCDWIQKAFGRRLEGNFKGTGDFEGVTGGLLDGSGRFEGTLFNGNIELIENILGFDTVAFDRIEAKGDLQTRTLKVNSLTMIGNDMNAELNGNIYLDGSAERTRIALKGFIHVPALNRKIPLSVGGTMAGPAINIRKN
ncbi:MAG: type II secretion system protein GspN [Syntrophales bacterium]|jgi:type II secretion system protein N|nr:type II secretion system protein GspN [Syntrophales bacterium]MDY0045378.1 type II secretion system protein GspN [Syntrophales bacterium]